MSDEKWYPQIIEKVASRNFGIGDEVKAYFKGQWFLGKVITKYKKRDKETPYILVKTYEQVDSEPGVYLEGFGLECKMDSLAIMFREEPFGGCKVFWETYLREMTAEEKKEYDDPVF